jgi:hypothetical protein
MPKFQAPTKSESQTGPESENISTFLEKVRSMPPAAKEGDGRGRLIFAMDATMSRQPTWDSALQIQGEMFREADHIGSLDVQLAYFRGFNECRASKWVNNPEALARLMSAIDCRGGHTQIERVLKHIKSEASSSKVSAAVFVGDAMEENIDSLCQNAGQIGLLGVPIFMFQEGADSAVERGFREIAKLTRGAYFRFDSGSAKVLRELLAAVAVYAAGGRAALADHSKSKGGSATLLLEQLR